ncbi:MAG: phage holin family protein [Anaerolineae bacterium]|nr:phage holin family protein [Anaerolineae bacterium]
MFRKAVLRWFVNALAVFAAVYLIPGIYVDGDQWVTIAVIALILGLVNALVRPLIQLLTLPVLILTLGLFSLAINTCTFWLSSEIGQRLGVGFYVQGFGAAFLGALVVSVVSTVLNAFVHDDRRHPRKRQEK